MKENNKETIGWIVVGMGFAVLIFLLGMLTAQFYPEMPEMRSSKPIQEAVFIETIKASYSITRSPVNLSFEGEIHEINGGNFIIGLMKNEKNHDIPIVIQMSRNPSNEMFTIGEVYLRGKGWEESKKIIVDEKIIQGGTSVIVHFQVPQSFGNTFLLEGTIIGNRTSQSGYYPFYIDILRESNGNIYHFKERKNIPQAPGFEGILVIAILILLSVAIRRTRGRG